MDGMDSSVGLCSVLGTAVKEGRLSLVGVLLVCLSVRTFCFACFLLALNRIVV